MSYITGIGVGIVLHMKLLSFYLTCLFFFFSAQAQKRPKVTNMKIMSSQGCLQLKFHKNLPKEKSKDSLAAPKDSVLIIFDRFDHTGAGVVYQVFYENEEHCINVPDVPKGKYYVTIQCLGIHRDRVETVVKIKSQKTDTIRINQRDSEEFSKNNVVIPDYHPDFQNLAIVRAK